MKNDGSVGPTVNAPVATFWMTVDLLAYSRTILRLDAEILGALTGSTYDDILRKAEADIETQRQCILRQLAGQLGTLPPELTKLFRERPTKLKDDPG